MQRHANPQALKHFLLPLSRRTLPPHRAFLSRQFTAAYSDSLPSVTNKEFWTNLIPKPLRRSNASKASSKPKSKEWNPATFYIWIFLLIGSMSIQMIALKNEHATFNRRADAKIGLLKEVVERVQRGEDVDVAGLLGKGDKKQEQEWHDGKLFYCAQSLLALIIRSTERD